MLKIIEFLGCRKQLIVDNSSNINSLYIKLHQDKAEAFTALNKLYWLLLKLSDWLFWSKTIDYCVEEIKHQTAGDIISCVVGRNKVQSVRVNQQTKKAI